MLISGRMKASTNHSVKTVHYASLRSTVLMKRQPGFSSIRSKTLLVLVLLVKMLKGCLNQKSSKLASKLFGQIKIGIKDGFCSCRRTGCSQMGWPATKPVQLPGQPKPTNFWCVTNRGATHGALPYCGRDIGGGPY